MQESNLPQHQKVAEMIQTSPKFGQAIQTIADEFDLKNYEKKIVILICSGLSVPEVAEAYGAKNKQYIYKTLSEIYAKTKCQSRTDLQTLVTHRLCLI